MTNETRFVRVQITALIDTWATEEGAPYKATAQVERLLSAPFSDHRVENVEVIEVLSVKETERLNNQTQDINGEWVDADDYEGEDE